ncbi:hypothetical protein BHM03_00035380 [Ensete ventricosum]|nr:hypothetical protein BHM03_00035380 [Ensete ventricosum]
MGKESASAAAREDEAKLQPWRGDGGDAHPIELETPHPVAAPPPARGKPPPLPQRQRDERWWPWLVPTIFAANVAMFVITMYVNDCRKNNTVRSCVLPSLGRFSFEPLKQNPLFGPSAKTSVPHLRSPFSLYFLVVRLFCLSALLWFETLNHLNDDASSLAVRIGPLYVIAGVGGSLLSALFVQSSVSVGASGALFGLLGAMLSELITNWTIYANKVTKNLYNICRLTVSLILLFRGFDGNDHCSWCHYLSCVPTSKWSCKQGTETCQVGCSMYPDLGGERGATTASVIDLGASKGLRWQLGPREEAATATSASAAAVAAVLAAAVTERRGKETPCPAFLSVS